MTIDWTAPERIERYRYDLLDNRLGYISSLPYVDSCSLDWGIYKDVRGGGTMNLIAPQHVEWQNYRIRVYIDCSNDGNDWDTKVLGTFVPQIPSETFVGSHAEVQLDLLDRTVMLRDYISTGSIIVPAGTNLSNYAATLLRGWTDVVGGTSSVTPSTLTNATATTWDWDNGSLTSLRVFNNLADALTYFAIYCDGYGNFVMKPYVLPGERVASWTLSDDSSTPRHRYVDGLQITRSNAAGYNTWYVYSAGTDTAPSVFAIATNTDPNHPFSVVAQGRSVVDIQTDVPYVSMADMQARANKLKADTMASQRTFELDARYIPAEEHEVVWVQNATSGVATRASISSRSLECKPGSLLKLTLQEIS